MNCKTYQSIDPLKKDGFDVYDDHEERGEKRRATVDANADRTTKKHCPASGANEQTINSRSASLLQMIDEANVVRKGNAKEIVESLMKIVLFKHCINFIRFFIRVPGFNYHVADSMKELEFASGIVKDIVSIRFAFNGPQTPRILSQFGDEIIFAFGYSDWRKFRKEKIDNKIPHFGSKAFFHFLPILQYFFGVTFFSQTTNGKRNFVLYRGMPWKEEEEDWGRMSLKNTLEVILANKTARVVLCSNPYFCILTSIENHQLYFKDALDLRKGKDKA